MFERRRGRGRRARDADGRGGERLRLAGRARRSTSTRRGGRATTRSSWRSTSARRCGATTRSSSCARSRAPDQRRSCSRSATNTWHAYNDFGGPNLYTGGTQVSLQRPMAPGYLLQAAGQGPAGDGDRTRPIRRSPRTSATSSSTTCRATPGRPAGPTGSCRSSSGPNARASRSTSSRTPTSRTTPSCSDRRRRTGCTCRSATTSTGRRGMRDTVEAFIGRGGNAAFFSGNTSFWQVRIEDATTEPASMVGYKGFFKNDPVFGTDREAEVTTLWSDHVVGRPENHMTGVTFTRGGYHRIGNGHQRPRRLHASTAPEHWIFDGTGLGYGDVLGAGADDRRLRVRRLRVHLPRRAAVPDRRGRHAVDLRDPRHRARRSTSPARPRRGRPKPRRAERVRVHRVARVRHPRPRGDGAHPPRPRGARRLHERRRRHGGHVGIDRLGARPRRTRPARSSRSPATSSTASPPETIGVRHRAFQVAR